MIRKAAPATSESPKVAIIQDCSLRSAEAGRALTLFVVAPPRPPPAPPDAGSRSAGARSSPSEAGTGKSPTIQEFESDGRPSPARTAWTFDERAWDRRRASGPPVPAGRQRQARRTRTRHRQPDAPQPRAPPGPDP